MICNRWTILSVLLALLSEKRVFGSRLDMLAVRKQALMSATSAMTTSPQVFYYVNPGFGDAESRFQHFENENWRAVQWGKARKPQSRRMFGWQYDVSTSFGDACINCGTFTKNRCKRNDKKCKEMQNLLKSQMHLNARKPLEERLQYEHYPDESADRIITDATFPITSEHGEVLAVAGPRGFVWAVKFILLGKWNGPIVAINPELDLLKFILNYVSDHSGDASLSNVRFFVATESREIPRNEQDMFSDRYASYAAELRAYSSELVKYRRLVSKSFGGVIEGLTRGSVDAEGFDQLVGFLDEAKAMVAVTRQRQWWQWW